MSPLPVDPSSNSNFVTQDIIEIKTLLVKVKTLLERESSLEELSKDTHHHHDTSEQRRLLEQQLETMKQELKLKNDKIEELEKIINTKKETVSTQVNILATLADHYKRHDLETTSSSSNQPLVQEQLPVIVIEKVLNSVLLTLAFIVKY